jgi:hypothetical protein
MVAIILWLLLALSWPPCLGDLLAGPVRAWEGLDAPCPCWRQDLVPVSHFRTRGRALVVTTLWSPVTAAFLCQCSLQATPHRSHRNMSLIAKATFPDGRAADFPWSKSRARETKGISEPTGSILAPCPLPRPSLASCPFVKGSKPEATKFLTEALPAHTGQHLNSSTN